LETVFLCSPTTHPDRLKLVGSLSSAFVYYVSRTGVTGAQKDISSTLNAEVAQIKRVIKNPLAIGFGISNPLQAKTIAQTGDAVIIGSAIVNLIETHQSNVDHAAKALEAFAKDISAAIR
jgi:tryptophan synthase alpha chain